MVGSVVVCLPEFTITMGVALVLPLTFGMISMEGLTLATGTCTSFWGGIISGVLGLIAASCGTEPMTCILRLPGIKVISTFSRQQFMKYPG